jgi:hypothetical protein
MKNQRTDQPGKQEKKRNKGLGPGKSMVSIALIDDLLALIDKRIDGINKLTPDEKSTRADFIRTILKNWKISGAGPIDAKDAAANFALSPDSNYPLFEDSL